jgi:hypothetical protein
MDENPYEAPQADGMQGGKSPHLLILLFLFAVLVVGIILMTKVENARQRPLGRPTSQPPVTDSL